MTFHHDLLIANDRYLIWRENKLNRARQLLNTSKIDLFVQIDNPASLSADEKSQIIDRCNQDNFFLYHINQKNTDTKRNIHEMAQQLGLHHLDNNICADSDSLTSITNTSHKGQHDYIPYTNKELSWHTDGYYNPPNRNIHSMLLHCVQPAAEGGESHIMDHELAYILLRDENPEYITALTQPDAMTIPANTLNGDTIRAAQAGPVFSLNNQGGIHMRYSARKRNIEWKQNTPTLEAVDFLNKKLTESPFIIKYKLKAGEGLICKNILHRRTSFVDFNEENKKRLLYRGRYYDQLLTN